MYHWQAQNLRRNFRQLKNDIERHKDNKEILTILQKVLIQNIRVVSRKKIVSVPHESPRNLVILCNEYITKLDNMMKVHGKDYIFIQED